MKKKTVLILVDRIFWAIILLLPVISFFLIPFGYSIGGGSSTIPVLPTFSEHLSNFGIISSNNPIFSVLRDMFGANAGIFPMFSETNTGMLLYFTYFINIEILHLLVDFLVFIPRLSHKWLNYLTRADEVD